MKARRFKPLRLLTLILLAGMTTAAGAEIRIEGAWSRATAPGLGTGGAYFHLINTGERGDRLVGVRSDRAPQVELHQTIEDGGNARMVHTPTVRVPANGELVFEPGGRHVMLMGLERALTEGKTYEIILKLERAGDLPMTVEVRSPTAMGADHTGHDAHGMAD